MSTENDRPPQRARARAHVGLGRKEGNLWESFIVGCKVMHAKREDDDDDVDRGDKGLVGRSTDCTGEM